MSAVQATVTDLKPGSSLRVNIGQTAMFTCSVEGYPRPNITWSFNGVTLSIPQNLTVGRTGNGLVEKLVSIVSITNKATSAHNGQLSCAASNAGGETQRTVEIIVQGNLRSDTQSVCVGGGGGR